LKFPVHVATATSHFVLVFIAAAGTLTHILNGTFEHGVRRAAALAVGVVIGAQLGAILSNRLQGSWIIRLLAVGLGAAGLRLIIGSL
jgi:uncharacterized membrane protein YfcA